MLSGCIASIGRRLAVFHQHVHQWFGPLTIFITAGCPADHALLRPHPHRNTFAGTTVLPALFVSRFRVFFLSFPCFRAEPTPQHFRYIMRTTDDGRASL
jgi:hypothetical protein